jgi:CCR4-NOT transcriptional regulation complex NOT5 subunit
MPKNQTTRATTKAVSKVGPYQVRGGLKGSSSSSSHKRGGKPTGTSRSKSSSQQQNDGRPESSSSAGSKQQDHGITARPGEQISFVYNSGMAAISNSATHRTSTTSLHTPRAGTPTSLRNLVSTTARTTLTTAATVFSNSSRGLESARPLQTMVPGSTTPQSHFFAGGLIRSNLN